MLEQLLSATRTATGRRRLTADERATLERLAGDARTGPALLTYLQACAGSVR